MRTCKEYAGKQRYKASYNVARRSSKPKRIESVQTINAMTVVATDERKKGIIFLDYLRRSR